MNRRCFVPFRKFCTRIPEKKTFSVKDTLAKITAGNILLFGGATALYSGHEEFERWYNKKNGMNIYKEVFGFTMGFVILNSIIIAISWVYHSYQLFSMIFD
jgi:hypothetical protein